MPIFKTYPATQTAHRVSQYGQDFHSYTYFPAKQKARQRILFYQGALVQAGTHAPLTRELSQKNVAVYLLKSPLNLPILDTTAAPRLIPDKPTIPLYLAGHSLGGAVASMNVGEAHQAKGLILLASYPSNKVDLSDNQLAVLSITASQDHILNWSSYEKAKKRLPKNTDFVQIFGGNHSGFGEYGLQKNNTVSTISPKQQRQEIVEIIAQFIQKQEP
ncbi:alpha/beta hydrolase [Streptococcus gallolyticus]|nr:alpha/beta hydrolase [Streptococcus gallolyticus]MBY5041659.1 alpha/beta hydrolase [Streptococcus gallolyticus]